MMIAISVNALCVLVALTCAVLLYQGWKRSGARLLFWSWLCFAGLGLANLLTVADYMTGPEIDLYLIRVTIRLLATTLLVYGLIWEVS